MGHDLTRVVEQLEKPKGKDSNRKNREYPREATAVDDEDLCNSTLFYLRRLPCTTSLYVSGVRRAWPMQVFTTFCSTDGAADIPFCGGSDSAQRTEFFPLYTMRLLGGGCMRAVLLFLGRSIEPLAAGVYGIGFAHIAVLPGNSVCIPHAITTACLASPSSRNHYPFWACLSTWSNRQ